MIRTMLKQHLLFVAFTHLVLLLRHEMTITNNNKKKVQTCILFVVFIHLALLLLGRATPGFQALFFTLTGFNRDVSSFYLSTFNLQF